MFVVASERWEQFWKTTTQGTFLPSLKKTSELGFQRRRFSSVNLSETKMAAMSDVASEQFEQLWKRITQWTFPSSFINFCLTVSGEMSFKLRNHHVKNKLNELLNYGFRGEDSQRSPYLKQRWSLAAMLNVSSEQFEQLWKRITQWTFPPSSWNFALRF